MKRIALFLIGLAAATMASPAAASVTFTIGNAPQPGQEAVIFANQGPATTLTGTSFTVPTNSLTLTGATTGGNQLQAQGGLVQASPANALITSLTLQPSSPLDLLILNPMVGNASITYIVLTNQSHVYSFTMAVSVGNNFVTIDPQGELLQTLTILGPAGFTNVTNFAAIFTPAAGGVPEPATWAMMLLGFAAMGLAFRRSRRLQPV